MNYPRHPEGIHELRAMLRGYLLQYRGSPVEVLEMLAETMADAAHPDSQSNLPRTGQTRNNWWAAATEVNEFAKRIRSILRGR